MEGNLVRNGEPEPPRAGAETFERVRLKLTRFHAALVDAQRREHWKSPGVTDIEQPIQVTTCAAHCPARLRPFDAARCRECAISCAYLLAGSPDQAGERLVRVEVVFRLRPPRALFQKGKVQRLSGRAFGFVIGDPLPDLSV